MINMINCNKKLFWKKYSFLVLVFRNYFQFLPFFSDFLILATISDDHLYPYYSFLINFFYFIINIKINIEEISISRRHLTLAQMCDSSLWSSKVLMFFPLYILYLMLRLTHTEIFFQKTFTYTYHILIYISYFHDSYTYYIIYYLSYIYQYFHNDISNTFLFVK